MSISMKYFCDSLIMALSRVPYTLFLTIATFTISAALGLLIAIVRNFKIKGFSQILGSFVTVYLGVPIMVAVLIYRLLFLSYYNQVADALNLPWAIGDIDIIYIALFALVLSVTCTMTEIFRGALSAIDRTQYDACYAIGMTKTQAMLRVILPQIVPIIFPEMISNFVGVIQATSLVSTVGVLEIMNGALLPAAKSYSYWEGYLAAALVYWGLTIIVENAGKKIETVSTRYRRQIND